MIDFSLSSRQEEIKEKYRDFAVRWIEPNARKFDELAEFPWPVIKAAYDEGIMNGPVPEKFGGNGYSILDASIASEEMGAGCIGIGIGIDANTLAITPLLIAGNEEQQSKFFGILREDKGVAAYCLTEPNAGSDVQGIKSTAILHGNEFILNGHKRFITNAEASSFFTVFAMTDPTKGSRSLTPFIVPANSPGIEMKPRLQKMGQRASVQNEIIFHDVKIPKANMLGKEGHGFLHAMKTFDRTRTGVASLSLGGARSAYETARNWSKKRIQFGKPIAANQAVAFMLAEMALKVENARMITWRAAWAYDTGQKDASKLSAMCKLYASDIAMEVTTDAVQVMAGEGYSTEYLVEKTMRDVKLCQIYEGTNQIQRLVISKSILKE